MELTLSVALLAVVAGSVAMVSSSTSDSARTARDLDDLDARLARAMDSVGERLMLATLVDVVPQPTGAFFTDQLDYVRLGSPERIVFQSEPADPENGIDDDGDGLVDEGMVVLIENVGEPGERTKVLCRSVRRFAEGEQFNAADDNGNLSIDEPGLSFRFDGRRATVLLTLETVTSSGVRLTRSLQRTVTVRN